MARREVKIAILGDSRDFEKALSSVGRAASGIGSKLAALGKAAAIGAAGAAVGLGAFAKTAIDAGSNLEETLSKSNTVFGTQAKAIEDWADGAAKAFGQSKQQALEAASSFGNMFSQLGLGDEQAAQMSRAMTELASDFASFHNADITEVLGAQQAAFRGEYDAVQRFVPTINAAAVEQKALEMGLAKTTKELDAQDKALATQALLLEGAGDAMGDFARTSDSLANKQRILSARFDDIKAAIGMRLMPIAMSLAGFVDDKLLPVFEKFGKEAAGAIGAFVLAFKAGDGDVTSSGFPGFMERLAFIARQAFDQIRAKVQEWGPVVVAVFQAVVAWVQENWPKIQKIIRDVMTTVASVVNGAVTVIRTLWENFGNNILEFVQRVWPAVQQTIKGVLETIRGIVATITALIQGDWSRVWEGIKGILSGVWSAMQGIVKGALEVVRLAVGAALEVIGSMLKGAWRGLGDLITAPFRAASDALSGIWGWIVQTVRDAVNEVRRLVDRALGPIDELVGKIGGLAGKAGGAVGGFLGKINPFDTGGVVPGPIGSPQLALVHGGETILPTHKGPVSLPGAGSSGGGGSPTTLQLVLDGKVLGQVLLDALIGEQRRSGALPLRVG